LDKEKAMSTKCKGDNCNAINGYGHSTECELEHDLNMTLNTAGNRNPEARYAGYKGKPCTYQGDEAKAWQEGRAAREQ
jgi:hypothetical protein